jgi:polar amino acid transport system permease protein
MFNALNLIYRNRIPILSGLWITVQLAVIVIIAGTLIGLLVGLALTYGPRWLRTIVRVYVDLIRGIPMLVTIFVIFYGLPIVLRMDAGAFESVALALSLFAGAYMAEIVRGAVTSIPKSQDEAGKSIGLTFWPRMQYVILPQAIRRALPPWVNLCVEIIKGTSLVSLVSVTDLMWSTTKLIERTHEPIPFYLTTGTIYFAICFTLSRFALRYEHRFTRYL